MAARHSTKFAAFQFYPRDFLADDKVARMTLTEVGIYISLLCYAWMGEGIPADLKQVARLCRLTPARFRRLWDGPLSECFVPRGGKLVNPRQERQRKELKAYVESCRRGGEQSARTRKARYGSSQPSKSGRSDHRSKPRSDPKVAPNTASATASASSTAKRESTGADAPAAHPIRDFLALHESLFVERTGRKPAKYTAKDATLAKGVLERHGVDEAERLLRRFMASSSDFVHKAGLGLNVFVSQINQLVTEAAIGPPPARPASGDKTAGNREAIQAFVDRRTS